VKLELPCLKTMLMIGIAPQSQLSSLAAQSTGLHHASESSVLPPKTGHANEALSTLKKLGRSHPIDRPEHAIQRPSLHFTFSSPPHTTSKRVVKLIVISDFVSPPLTPKRTSAHPRHVSGLTFCVSAFPRPVRGVSSPIASFRTPSHSARTFQYVL
jgi:hypothetical protein